MILNMNSQLYDQQQADIDHTRQQDDQTYYDSQLDFNTYTDYSGYSGYSSYSGYLVLVVCFGRPCHMSGRLLAGTKNTIYQATGPDKVVYRAGRGMQGYYWQ